MSSPALPGPAAPNSAQFDGHAATYADEVNASIAFIGLKVDYFTKVKAAYTLDRLAEHFGRSDNLALLDVGCGTGGSHALLGEKVAVLAGTDVSKLSLDEAARVNPGVAYKPYDGHRLPYADASFDAAMTVCVMHHVPPPQWPGFAAEMKRVVRPGGLALVFEHNPLNPLTRRAVSNCEFDADAVLLPQRRTRALLDGAGFTAVRSRSILSIPSVGPRTRAIDSALGRLALGAQYIASGIA
jgi:SAM-dependent methyltransferase